MNVSNILSVLAIFCITQMQKGELAASPQMFRPFPLQRNMQSMHLDLPMSNQKNSPYFEPIRPHSLPSSLRAPLLYSANSYSGNPLMFSGALPPLPEQYYDEFEGASRVVYVPPEGLFENIARQFLNFIKKIVTYPLTLLGLY